MAQEFEIPLVDTNDEEFNYHLPNELDNNGNPIPHREWTTGTDRAPMSVKGRMSTVVHASGYTIAIFDWFMPPVQLGKRFRKVTLEVVFTAHGTRGLAEPEAQQRRRAISNKAAADAHWHPKVEKWVPAGTSWYQESSQHLDEELNLQFDLKAAFEPFFSIGPSVSWKRATPTDFTDSVKLSGDPMGSGAVPNGVRWTMVENASARTGVPAFLRTAVLLRRRDRDNGQFLGRVKASYTISPASDFKQSILNLLGVRRDKPVIFDPNYPTPASPYDAKRAAFASPDVAANLEKEFRLISIETAKGEKDSNNLKADAVSSTSTAANTTGTAATDNPETGERSDTAVQLQVDFNV